MKVLPARSFSALGAAPLAYAVMSGGATLSNEKACWELGWTPAAVGAREAVESLAGRDRAVRG
jgi:hypothetical protein